MTWFDRAAAIIAHVHKSIAKDADLRTRRTAIRAARPPEFISTSWGRKVWQQAQREYLVKFGLKPRGWKNVPLSPLEQAIARAKARDERRAT